MTYDIVAPDHFSEILTLPASKSISNRVLIIRALSGVPLELAADIGLRPADLSNCDDTEVMYNALAGGQIREVDVKAAGTAMRFLTAYYSVTPGERVITGTERMRQRPIGVLVDALRSLGANIEYVGNEGYPPLRITGCKLEGGDVTLQGNISSQYISALMMIAPMLKKGLNITLVGGVASRPYIDMTMKIMEIYGAEAEWKSDNHIYIPPTKYWHANLTVENDWTAASYWYEIAALSECAWFSMFSLFRDSVQGDRAVKDMFEKLGVETWFRDKINATITKKHDFELPSFLELDFEQTPDLAQTLVVTCCMLGVHFRFTGLHSLRIKETDRIAALEKELRKCGFVVHDADDSVMWWDGECVEPTNEPIDTYQDHRMAMAFAPMAIRRKHLRINNPEVVSKSYPNYWCDLKKVGFKIREFEDD